MLQKDISKEKNCFSPFRKSNMRLRIESEQFCDDNVLLYNKKGEDISESEDAEKKLFYRDLE